MKEVLLFKEPVNEVGKFAANFEGRGDGYGSCAELRNSSEMF